MELKVERGDFDGADATLAKVGDNEKIRALVPVASALIKKGNRERTFGWANYQTSPLDRAYILIGIVNARQALEELTEVHQHAFSFV